MHSGEYITSVHVTSQAAARRRGSQLARHLGPGLHQASLKPLQEFSKGAFNKFNMIESLVTNLFLFFSQHI